MSLADKKKAFKGKTIDFMNGREAGKMADLIDKEVTITDIDIIKSRKDEYAVFIIKEDDKHFYFGGAVLTNFVKTLSEEDFDEVRRDGMAVKFSRAKSQDGFTYTNVDFL